MNDATSNETTPSMTPAEATTIVKRARTTAVLQLIRGLFQVISVLTITVWGFLAWPMPVGILSGLIALVVSVVVWALFLSPKPVLRTDHFAQALVELVLIAGAVGAMLGLGVHWALPVAFGVIAAVIGYIGSMRVR
ncbi:YrdB family protein [Leucobacter sp. cx-328]|uniref:DUF2568 domain-containing protein n=1 Tax=unclassified Leucobacter TaxID=2621730 RepID=UPI0019B2681C|nr:MULTISPECIES: DUF2568 domain-containing protein [unclassified Leucobacter]MBC9944681.1 YrdB family protein [Leucobacter sp. cx-328]